MNRPDHIQLFLAAACLVGGCYSTSDSSLETDGTDAGTLSAPTGNEEGGPGEAGATSATGNDAETGGNETGDEDSGESEAGDDGSSSDGGSVDSGDAPCQSTCIAEAPIGWFGPVTVQASADGTAACSGNYPNEELAKKTDLAAPPAQCECECEAAGFSCNDGELLEWQNSTCDSEFAIFTTLENGVCTTPNDGFGNPFYSAPNPGLAPGGTCAPTSSAVVAPGAFDTDILLCGADDLPGLCDPGETCAPELEDVTGALCIHHPGDVACPEGPFTERTVYHDDFDDDRGCSECVCGTGTGSCTGSIDFVSGNCSAVPVLEDSIALGSCQTVTAPFTQVVLNVSADITCPQSGGTPTGAATPIEPTTVCCQA